MTEPKETVDLLRTDGETSGESEQVEHSESHTKPLERTVGCQEVSLLGFFTNPIVANPCRVHRDKIEMQTACIERLNKLRYVLLHGE